VTGHLSELVSSADAPLFVVTTQDSRERSGCVVGFVTQCSIYPERFVVCLSRLNHTYEVARRAKALGVHLLLADDSELAHRFGEMTGDEVDKFAGIAVETASCGAPIFRGERPWVAGFIEDIHPFGDHVGFVIQPTESGGHRSSAPMRLESIELEAGHPPEESVPRE